MIKQKTIKGSVQISGIGLHTGKKVLLKMFPVLDSTGIIYRRIDLNPSCSFRSNVFLVKKTKLCTCLIYKKNVFIHTIEHLSAALSGLGIDNILIEIDAPEIPILDGSSRPFIDILLTAGIKQLDREKKFIRIKKKFV